MFAKQQVFRDRGKRALDAETAREKLGDCAKAANTVESNACLTREMGITDANYKSYVLALGGMMRSSSSPEEAAAGAEVGRKFDASEALWGNYRKAACDTVYQHYIQGTIRGIAYGNCMQRLERSHMHDLAEIYSEMMSN